MRPRVRAKVRKLRIIEYWKQAYDATNKNQNKNNNARRFSIYEVGSIDFKNDDDNDIGLPFEPTAVLAKALPNQPIKRSIYNISSLDFTT